MKYKTYEENGKQILERVVYPRFKAEITFSAKKPSDLENFEWIDPMPEDVMEFSRLMRMTGEFLTKGHQINNGEK